MINIATVFSGIGTPELALQSMNIEHNVLFAAEIDKYARETYLNNCKLPNKFYTDVSKIDGSMYSGQVNLFVGGSPCQSFSMAGKRGGFKDTRGTLFYEYVRLIKEIQPDVFIYENVKGIQSHDKGKTFNIVLNTFKELNYFFKWNILNTADYGIPQNRERFYCVGFKNKMFYDDFNFEKPYKLKTSWRDFVLIEKKVNPKFTLTEKNYKHYNRSFGSKGKNITDMRICPTLTESMGTGGGNVPYFKSEIKIEGETQFRKLTPRECFNLQGFDDSFKFPSNMSNGRLYKQAGNAMSLNILKMIIKKLREINAI
jgi:DNA (cytosine-5)-methyltransferase 1